MSDEDLNLKVYKWARSKLGHMVDRGECWDLAHRALQHAGAQSSTTTGEKDDYVWGARIPVQAAIPGDILQFREYMVTTIVTTDVTFDDGSGDVSVTESPLERPHHTAIVAENKGAFGLMILEQRIPPGGRKVQLNALPLAATPPVVKTDFRSVKDATGKVRRAKVVVTTTKHVRGKVWAYRPRAKP